jgi:DNA-binding NtrC family response regulator
MSQLLVVDDDMAFTVATAEFLGQKGYAVTTALNLRNAREALQRTPFDIVLLDVMLPDGSGLELLHEIDPAADTRIVIMTGHPTIDVAVDSLRARAADFLVKPVEPRQLLNCLDSIQRALARVTRPISSPYSSTTRAMRSSFSWKYWVCANTGVVAGTK